MSHTPNTFNAGIHKNPNYRNNPQVIKLLLVYYNHQIAANEVRVRFRDEVWVKCGSGGVG